MTLFERFARQVEATAATDFLIAFSGGLDSTVLLALFAKLRQNRPHFHLRAIHVHHNLSPNADRWAAHCEQVCHHLNIPLIVEKVSVQGNQGVESNARHARYFGIKRHLAPMERLATAHHLQDQTETFLLALKRGSGIQGLGAMQPQNRLFGMPVFRPLLNEDKAALQAYAEQENLPWIEDESNVDEQYDRNFLRHRILPPLRQRWGHFDTAVQRAAQHCFEQQQLIDELLTAEFERAFDAPTGSIDITDFGQYSPQKQTALLRRWLAALHCPMPTTTQLQQIRQTTVFAQADAAPLFRLNGQAIRRYRQRLYLTPLFADLRPICLPITPSHTLTLPDHLGTLQSSFVNSFVNDFVSSTANSVINNIVQHDLQSDDQHHIADNSIMFRWTDAQQTRRQSCLPATTQPISVRFRYSGSVKLHPRRPPQDIKKLWQQCHLPPWQRHRVPLIFYGDTFQAAVGYFQRCNE